MGRYRPPGPRGSPYITPEGHRRLSEELDYLWRQKRPEITRSVSEAAAQGDRSENAEYIYGKKQLREIDRRVRFLRKRLDGIKVVDRPPDDTSRVYFGAWFSLEDERGAALDLRLVGPDEFEPARGWISMDSPMGRAVLGKGLDEEVSLETPAGQRHYQIRAIRYGQDAD